MNPRNLLGVAGGLDCWYCFIMDFSPFPIETLRFQAARCLHAYRVPAALLTNSVCRDLVEHSLFGFPTTSWARYALT